MADAKERVSVVRIPRQVINQTNSNEMQDNTNKDPSNLTVIKVPRQVINQTNSNEMQDNKDKDPPNLTVTKVPRQYKILSKNNDKNEISTTKLDIFTPTLPPISDIKSDELKQQNIPTPPLRPFTIIQHQPTPVNTLIKRSFNNEIRPELNWNATGEWSHGLYSLLTDFNMCCYACACWCCFRHELSSMMGEHWCLWFVNCTPLMELRTKFRQQYSIEGSIAEDFCLATFCPLCVALQIANEGRQYGHRIFN